MIEESFQFAVQRCGDIEATRDHLSNLEVLTKNLIDI